MSEFYKNNSCDKSLIDRIEVEIGKPFHLSYKKFLFVAKGLIPKSPLTSSRGSFRARLLIPKQ
jgi:hypothetical protein